MIKPMTIKFIGFQLGNQDSLCPNFAAAWGINKSFKHRQKKTKQHNRSYHHLQNVKLIFEPNHPC